MNEIYGEDDYDSYDTLIIDGSSWDNVTEAERIVLEKLLRFNLINDSMLPWM